MTANSIHPENIPEYFQKTPRWVLFKLIEQPDGSKPKKEPRYANNPQILASISKPVSWADFPTALEAAKRYNMLMGFAILPKSKLLLIDIDDISGKIDGKRKDGITQKLIASLNTYSERSQSGEGIHILGWYQGPKPKIDGIETYTGDRFCIFTGDRISETSVVNDITDTIDTLAKEGIVTFEKPTESRYRPPVGTITPGGREPELFRYTRSLVAKGLPLDDISPLVLKYNSEHCNPPHPESYVLERVQEWYDRPDEFETQPSGGIDLPATDFGNARRLLNAYRGGIRYDTANKQWYLWTQAEGRWKPDTVGKIEEMAKEVIRALQIEAKVIYAKAEEETNADAKKALEKQAAALYSWAIRSQTPARVAACITLASSEVAVEPAMFDRDLYLWNLTNGTYDLKNHVFNPHDRENLITKTCGYAYDPGATCPGWEKNLERCFLDRPDKKEILDYLQRVTGYSLTGDTSEQAIYLLHGGGANGKTALLESLGLLFGDYAGTIAAASLTTEGSRAVRDDLSVLPGKRLITANENAQNSTLDEELIKRLSGGDKIKTRALYGKYFEYTPQLKLFWSFNHPPNVRDMSVAMWRRIKLLAFEREIPEPERIPLPELLARHKNELPGIFNWALEGLKNYQKNGLRDIPAVQTGVREFRQEQDILVPFFDDACSIYRPGGHIDKRTPKEIEEWISSAGDLYDTYAGWAHEKGVRRPLSSPLFGRAMKERGFEKFRTGSGIFYRNIKITTKFENPKYFQKM